MNPKSPKSDPILYEEIDAAHLVKLLLPSTNARIPPITDALATVSLSSAPVAIEPLKKQFVADTDPLPTIPPAVT